MSTVFLPLIANGAGTAQAESAVPFGWAYWGTDHDLAHKRMLSGEPMQNWFAYDCDLPYGNYLPSLSGPRWWVRIHRLDTLVVAYPPRTWLLWNEPDYPTQANIPPGDALGITAEWTDILHAQGHTIAGYGCTVTDPNGPARDCWRRWLDGFLAAGGPLPDVWHIHIYARTVAAWQAQYELWQVWNEQHGNLPTIISECGEGPEVYAYLRRFTDARVQALLWFTDFSEPWL